MKNIMVIEKPKSRKTFNAVIMQRILVIWTENECVYRIEKSARVAINKFREARQYERILLVESIISKFNESVLKTIDETCVAILRFTVQDMRAYLNKFKKEIFSGDLTDAEFIAELLQSYSLRQMDWKLRMKNYSEEARRKLLSTISQGYASGMGAQEMVIAIQRVISVIKHRAVRIARTESQFASNTALQEIYSSMPDVVKGIEYVVTLDDRTCPVCGGYAGNEYYYDPKGQQYSVASAPQVPLHPLCRCVYAPIERDWEELGGKPKANAPKRDKAPDYKQWLKSQSPETQKKILGKDFDAYKSGGFDDIKKTLQKRLNPINLGDEWEKKWKLANNFVATQKLSGINTSKAFPRKPKTRRKKRT